MQLFGSKRTNEEPMPKNVEEHKQNIGNQVMEALGVREDEENYNTEEETEIMMPQKNQTQLAAEEMAKKHESICIISTDATVKGGIEVENGLMVAGRVKGDISASTLTCVGPTCEIEGNIICDVLTMHGGTIKGNVAVNNKATINGEIEGNLECKDGEFGEHAVVRGDYIRCEILKVEPGAQIAAKIEMGRGEEEQPKPARRLQVMQPKRKEPETSESPAQEAEE